ncbi:major capsid protein [Pantoea ananatis]|uniref:major capsid protein n=1 Tax=Pantoea ananas TaxID=553 RepID=UPI0021ACF0A3|nr:major capsid protein [Pantoea ananatis]
MIDMKQFTKLDTVAAIKQVPQGTFLLSSLNLFQTSTSQNPNAQILDIVEKEVDKLQQVSRYGTETNSISVSKPLLRNQEIPTVHTTSAVRPADWQGLMSASNPSVEAAVNEVIANKAIRMRNAKLEYVEDTLAKALFEQKADASKTDDGDLDFNAIFGTTPQNFTLGVGTTDSIYEQLGQIRRAMAKQYGAARSYVSGYYAFLSPEMFDAIASHPSVTTLILNKVSEAARGALIADDVAGYAAMSIGNITFICVDDERYKVADDSGLIVPKFQSTASDYNPLKMIVGPCSRNQTIASKGVVSDLYQWINLEKNDMLEINQEHSSIPLILRTNYLMNVKLK